MASYVDWIAFRHAVLTANFINRKEFLSVVALSHIQDPTGLPDSPATRALLTLLELRLVPPTRTCPSCSMAYSLHFKAGRYRWCGPRRDASGCPDCVAKEYQVTSIGFLRNVKQQVWMQKLDCFVMWSLEYPRQLLLRELHPTMRKTLEPWITQFQQAMTDWYEVQMHDGFDGAFSQEVLRKPSSGTKAQKKPASSCKRPASSSTSMKRPGVKKIYLKSSRDARISIADETHLNKRKPNALAKRGRPQSDQVWLWGAVLQGHIKTHFSFRILEHPQDSFDGKPRGHKEMLQNINKLGLRKGDIFVSDKWQATVSAMKAFRQSHGFTQQTLPHEIVNHSKGEIVNLHGFSTNPIECKWSVIKRWIRQRMSGKLPSHTDRTKWRLLINEYEARAMLKFRNSQPLDYDHYVVVRFRDVAALFQVA